MAVPPWATEIVLSPWLAANEDRVLQVLPHVVWWKKKFIPVKQVIQCYQCSSCYCCRKNFVFLFGTWINLTCLWSSDIFTKLGWLILFSPDHFPGQHKNGESPPNYLFPRTFRTGRTYFLSAPFIAAESQHHEESRLIYGAFESTLLDQGFPVEHELDACNPPLTGTLLCCLELMLCLQRRAISLRHPATSFLGNPFQRPSCLCPTATRTTHLWVTTLFLSLNSKHFCYLYSDAYSAQTFSIALTLVMYILLKH